MFSPGMANAAAIDMECPPSMSLSQLSANLRFAFIIHPMLKKIVYMLIVAFTLQLSWGVASAYCMHETGRAVKHFGHHQHQHHSSDAASATADDHQNSTPKKLAADPDCASCTHSPLAAYTWQAELVQPLLPSYQLLAPPSELPTPYLGMPERPQWTVAA